MHEFGGQFRFGQILGDGLGPCGRAVLEQIGKCNQTDPNLGAISDQIWSKCETQFGNNFEAIGYGILIRVTLYGPAGRRWQGTSLVFCWYSVGITLVSFWFGCYVGIWLVFGWYSVSILLVFCFLFGWYLRELGAG